MENYEAKKKKIKIGQTEKVQLFSRYYNFKSGASLLAQ